MGKLSDKYDILSAQEKITSTYRQLKNPRNDSTENRDRGMARKDDQYKDERRYMKIKYLL